MLVDDLSYCRAADGGRAVWSPPFAPLLIDFKTSRYFTATLILLDTISPGLCPDQMMTWSRHSDRCRASPSDFLHARCCV